MISSFLAAIEQVQQAVMRFVSSFKKKELLQILLSQFLCFQEDVETNEDYPTAAAGRGDGKELAAIFDRPAAAGWQLR